ncbi:MAG: extensin family protein [Enterovirga sp.]|nr:extensin family protein [Enterovirga sp.]
MQSTGELVCAVETPVRLKSVADPYEAGRSIALPDEPVVACRYAAAFAPWLGRVAAPVAKAGRGSALVAVRTGPGFQCRGRNRQAGEKLSAHGEGLALDIAGLVFADGRTMTVVQGLAPEGGGHPAFEAIRTAACGWFTTVLGPGSDAFHTDHLHLDIQRHGASDRYRICQ